MKFWVFESCFTFDCNSGISNVLLHASMIQFRTFVLWATLQCNSGPSSQATCFNAAQDIRTPLWVSMQVRTLGPCYPFQRSSGFYNFATSSERWSIDMLSFCEFLMCRIEGQTCFLYVTSSCTELRGSMHYAHASLCNVLMWRTAKQHTRITVNKLRMYYVACLCTLTRSFCNGQHILLCWHCKYPRSYKHWNVFLSRLLVCRSCGQHIIWTVKTFACMRIY